MNIAKILMVVGLSGLLVAQAEIRAGEGALSHKEKTRTQKLWEVIKTYGPWVGMAALTVACVKLKNDNINLKTDLIEKLRGLRFNSNDFKGEETPLEGKIEGKNSQFWLSKKVLAKIAEVIGASKTLAKMVDVSGNDDE